MEINVIYVIVVREFKRFTREKSRVVAAIARPMLWLFFVGEGMSKLVSHNESGMSYMQFIFPGILGMTILFSSIFSSISIIWDREFGFMKEMLVAPISRFSIVLGKGISGSFISTFQALVILSLFPIVGLDLSLSQFIGSIGICLMLSLCISLIGIVIAEFFTSFESFSVIMNFIVMPMFFLSGAMYPIKTLPAFLKWATKINPLTYGVDALKNIMHPRHNGLMSPDFDVSVDIAVIVGAIAFFLTIAVKSFKIRD
jgi:ABC-2 type transport system permease protein